MVEGQVSTRALALGCEARVGVSYSGPKPFIVRCGKVGAFVKAGVRPFGVWLCADHTKEWKAGRLGG